MELLKKNIQMNRIKCKSNVQLTLDDDFNVPDVKPDVAEIVKEQGDITVQEIKAMNGKAVVKGNLNFSLLYISEDDYQRVHNITGSLAFEELINMDAACAEDVIQCHYEMEDLSTSLINSRKVSVRAIVTFYCTAEDSYEQETGIGVSEGEDVYTRSRSMDITQLVTGKKDTFRIKDEIMLPTGKDNIEEILYQEADLRGVEYRMTDGGLHISGDMLVFLLYNGEGEEQSVNFHTLQIPFSETIVCEGCKEDMTADVEAVIKGRDFQIKPDDDGEQRIIDVEAVVEMDIKVYEQEEITVLEDMYALGCELSPVRKMAHYERLLMRNGSKLRINDQMEMDSDSQVLQICHAGGSIKIDEERAVPDGVEVEGALEVQILYISSDDEHPLGYARGDIPFSHMVEIKGMNENSTYHLRSGLEQVSVNMLDGKEAEVRAIIGLDVIAFDNMEESVITDIKEENLDNEKWQNMPGLVGYVVKEGDSLWSIAKEFLMSMDSIMELNGLESDKISKGDKLLLMKQMPGMRA